jgi:hypothetical protein
MMDDHGRQVIWEDTIEPAVEETNMTVRRDAAAETIPAWTGEGAEEVERESI